MKKYFLAGLVISNSFLVAEEQQLTAGDALREFSAEATQQEKDELLGVKLLGLCETKKFRRAFARLLTIEFDKEELVRLKELFLIMIDIQERTLDPLFKGQLEIFMQESGRLETEQLTDEERVKIMDRVRLECPLVCEWLELPEELKFLHAGIGQGMQTLRLDTILIGLLNDLDTLES